MSYKLVNRGLGGVRVLTGKTVTGGGRGGRGRGTRLRAIDRERDLEYSNPLSLLNKGAKCARRLAGVVPGMAVAAAAAAAVGASAPPHSSRPRSHRLQSRTPLLLFRLPAIKKKHQSIQNTNHAMTKQHDTTHDAANKSNRKETLESFWWRKFLL